VIRAALVVLAVVVLAVVVIALRGEPCVADVTWLGWNLRATAAAAVLLLIFFTLAAALAWRGLIWLAEAPRRAARARAEIRRRQGTEALTRGFLAAAAGDGAEARRQAGRAAELADDTPALVRLLSAQAAEAAGDAIGARAAYHAMLGFPDLRLIAHKGLMQAALADGDAASAHRHAAAAYGLARTAPWAWRAVLESRLAEGDWDAALELMKGALERRIVSPIVAERARAALLTARAAGEAPDDALDDAQAAVKLRPDFTPAAVVAARRLADDDRASRAAQVIEAAWKARPHPALWLAYRDLHPGETPPVRAARLAGLAAFNPTARESHILLAEQSLIAGDAPAARTAAKELDDEPLTRRVAALRARIATALGDRDEAAPGSPAAPRPRRSPTGPTSIPPAAPSPTLPPTGAASPWPTPSTASSPTPGSSAASAASATYPSCPPPMRTPPPSSAPPRPASRPRRSSTTRASAQTSATGWTPPSPPPRRRLPSPRAAAPPSAAARRRGSGFAPLQIRPEPY
jgi:HemY protein